LPRAAVFPTDRRFRIARSFPLNKKIPAFDQKRGFYFIESIRVGKPIPICLASKLLKRHPLDHFRLFGFAQRLVFFKLNFGLRESQQIIDLAELAVFDSLGDETAQNEAVVPDPEKFVGNNVTGGRQCLMASSDWEA